ncbi:MAG: MFS transporter [Lachnospiraceae bacterium]|nr:MFS transporter [Lachnospiraceae bacterium]
MNIKNNYNHTLRASYLGYITQAIVNNFAPLLFLTFQKSYHISLDKIALLITMNFGVQLVVDFLAIKFVDKIGYKICIVVAHIFAAVGLAGIGVFPDLFGNPYAGLICAVFLYAIGGGLIEVLISPIVEACPTTKKSAHMSLLHSFYCWGQVGVILGSTIFFVLAGIENWRMLALIWAVIPLFNAVYFAQVPIATLIEEDEEGMTIKELFGSQIFWVFVLLMICAGAAEHSMAQWASAFAESSLQVSKTIGDLAGPCFFAIMMGISRVFYSKFSEKIELHKFMIGSAVLCVLSYLLAALSASPVLALLGCGLSGLAVGIFWPGTFSIAAARCRRGGITMFALLALAGDLGCSAGPTIVGFVSDAANDNLKAGLLVAIIFPLILIGGIMLEKNLKVAIPENESNKRG